MTAAGVGAELVVRTTAGPLLTDVEQAIAHLVDERFMSRAAAKDHTLWGPAAEAEASKRLGWVSAATDSAALLAPLAELRARVVAQGLTRIVLCGMGGSSLAPEVIAADAGVPLTVLDSSDPDMVRSCLAGDLAATLVIIASKSGSTVETDSQKRAFEAALTAQGLDPADHLVIVTDPGSALEASATEDGYPIIQADPEVGGRYSALTAFGLVPSALGGIDIAALLDQALAVTPLLTADDPANPALRLGVLLGVAARAGIDKVALAEVGPRPIGFGDWAEQLIAESTGKDGTGILPVVVSSSGAPNFSPSSPDEVLVSLGGPHTVTPASGVSASVSGDLGATFLLWEYAVAVASRILAINPFDQPDVESAKLAARSMLDGTGDAETPILILDGIEVYGPADLLDGVTNLDDVVNATLGAIQPDRGYLAVMAYLDRLGQPQFAHVRDALAARTGRPTTFGWGPRFLHSTGQYHKGGAPIGVYLQITAEPDADLEIPGRAFTFATFLHAQARGDAHVLRDRGRPVFRLHLASVDTGLAALTQALR